MEEDKYNVANQRIHQWLKEGVMAKESQPAFFISRQEFTLERQTHCPHRHNRCSKASSIQ